MSNLSITNAIRTVLISNEAVADKLKRSDSEGNITYNVFPLFAPNGTTGDFILYKREGFNLERSKMGISQEKCKIIINVVCSNYDESQELAEMVYSALDHSFISPIKMDVKLTDSDEDIDSIKDSNGVAAVRYVQILYFSIK